MSDQGNIGTLVRSKLWFDGGFTQIPNSWIRDGRVSFAARGVLAWMVSHDAGFEITILGIAAGTAHGVDAIRSYVGELERAGYLKRYRRRDRGRIVGTTWHLLDPHMPVENLTLVGLALEPSPPLKQRKPRSGPERDLPGVAGPGVAGPGVAGPALENPTTKEDQLKEDLQVVPEEPAIDARAKRALERCPRVRAGARHLLDESGYCIACLVNPSTGRSAA